MAAEELAATGRRRPVPVGAASRGRGQPGVTLAITCPIARSNAPHSPWLRLEEDELAEAQFAIAHGDVRERPGRRL